ncbi:MAG: 3-phosphoshikimate 1-carboxyvinyltransferase [Myxococcota bacterium]|nr:3-phosphoshikimate 1-carboxyvinyltransferase [Myxococcota bacterium]
MKRIVTRSGRPLRGELYLPGDKSISHRALIFNGMASGEAKVEGLLRAKDVEATADCLRALGVGIREDGDSVIVTGCGGRLTPPSEDLYCGNSGTTMRLMAGVLASQPFEAVLDGDKHLRERPMGRIMKPLSEMGASFQGREGGEVAPLLIRGGGLTAGEYRSPVASAQVKSALILATLGAGGGTLRFSEPHRSRDHTERMLAAMQIDLAWEDDVLVVPSAQVAQATDVCVPADISSAAFFLVAATITPGSDLVLRGVGVNPSRTGILDALDSMGADIAVINAREVSGEPIADLHVRASELSGTELSGGMIPRMIDEIPVLAVAASFARGVTKVSDAAELRVKESDRIATTVTGLKQMGVDAQESPDGLVVRGGAVTGGRVHAAGDHRIAMSFAVAGCAATGETVVEDAENVATSFPEFATCLEEAMNGS